ncbi:Peptidoglycan-binding LysM [Planctopirus limnophila DSM 3776]|uniref:Peptidoglycan-binding LysM n=1 Tax=Planctopirus limnophila (strain ATCC 43296 / DSM 3776 / IFAM 1008 / Mu 290) TaxID=521674 RepID=D5SXQ0_PLAL2|nr:LysM peptidoglycan-binding domain-containing protein [Planctopirus limnophila]ADG67617.1 Peptidoglycan-binding LysM [Planctopirus limnophila DSM 3776]
MARETKVGLVLVVVLACGFGLLLYKRLQHPQITVAQATEGASTGLTATEISADDIKAEIQLASSNAASSSSSTESKPATTLPSSLENELLDLKNDPVASPVANSKSPARSLPSLPTDLDDMAFPAETPPAAVAASTPKSTAVDADPFSALDLPSDQSSGSNLPANTTAPPAITASGNTSKTVEIDPFAGGLEDSKPTKTSPAAIASSRDAELTLPAGNLEPLQNKPVSSEKMATSSPANEDPFALESPADEIEKPSAPAAKTTSRGNERSLAPSKNQPSVPQDDPFSMPVEIPANDASLAADSQANVVESLELPVQVEPKRSATSFPVNEPAQPKTQETSRAVPELGFAELEQTPAKAKTPSPAVIDEFGFDNPSPQKTPAQKEPAQPALPLDLDSDPFGGSTTIPAPKTVERPASNTPSLPVNNSPANELDAFGFETPAASTSGLKQPAPAALPMADNKPVQQEPPFPDQLSIPATNTQNSVNLSLEPGSATPPSQRYTVEPSDNFWSISRKVYGSGRYFNALASHNAKAVPRPEAMKPGTTIEIPPVEFLEQKYGFSNSREVSEAARNSAPPEGTNEAPASGFFIDPAGVPMYKVSDQDTMSGIARAHLGRSSRWIQILELNRDKLQDGNTIAVGTILRLPPDASQVQVMNTSPGTRN